MSFLDLLFVIQVEQNIDYVQKKRDESFLQLDKCNSNFPFMQYYQSILDKAASRNLALDKKLHGTKQNHKKRPQVQNDQIESAANGKVHSEKRLMKKRKA